MVTVGPNGNTGDKNVTGIVCKTLFPLKHTQHTFL